VSELAFTIARLGFLALLWFFVFLIIRTLRRDTAEASSPTPRRRFSREKNTPAAAPSGKPQYMVFTIMARLRVGQYSLNSVTALGMAAPKPKPVIKRKTPISHKLPAKADAVQNPENTSTDTVSTGFRPNLSAKGPDVTAPAAKPNNAALNTGARSCLPIPQSSDRLGAI